MYTVLFSPEFESALLYYSHFRFTPTRTKNFGIILYRLIFSQKNRFRKLKRIKVRQIGTRKLNGGSIIRNGWLKIDQLQVGDEGKRQANQTTQG